MAVVFNEDNPIVGRDGIEAVVDLIKDNAYDISELSGDLSGLSNRVGDLESTAGETLNIANNQLNELIDGKAQIAQALTDRGYPTAPTDSSASMAQKIENMSYDAGWLAQLGYTEQNVGDELQKAIDYAKEKLVAYDGRPNYFAGDTQLQILPYVDFSQQRECASAFSGCSSLKYIPKLDFSSAITMGAAFQGCALQNIDIITGPNCTAYNNLFWSAKLPVFSVKTLDFSATTNIMYMYANTLRFLLIKNLGKSSATSYNLGGNNVWGLYTDENRQSLVDSLLTYSFDRATAEYSACTITLHANTLARLTSAEIAAITAKGFTLTS